MRGVLAFLVLVGCSNPARSPHGTGNGDGDPKPPDAGVPAATIDAPPPEAPVTEAECDALIDHVIDLTQSQTYDELPPAEREAARADAHTKLRGEFLPQCLQLDRAGYDCLIAAPDTNAFAACGG